MANRVQFDAIANHMRWAYGFTGPIAMIGFLDGFEIIHPIPDDDSMPMIDYHNDNEVSDAS